MPTISFDVKDLDDLRDQVDNFLVNSVQEIKVEDKQSAFNLEDVKPEAGKTKKQNKAPKKGQPSKAALQKALQKVTETKGLTSARELLQKFNAERLSDLEDDQYKDFLKACGV